MFLASEVSGVFKPPWNEAAPEISAPDLAASREAEPPMQNLEIARSDQKETYKIHVVIPCYDDFSGRILVLPGYLNGAIDEIAEEISIGH